MRTPDPNDHPFPEWDCDPGDCNDANEEQWQFLLSDMRAEAEGEIAYDPEQRSEPLLVGRRRTPAR